MAHPAINMDLFYYCFSVNIKFRGVLECKRMLCVNCVNVYREN